MGREANRKARLSEHVGNIWPGSSCWGGRREGQEERTAGSQRVEKASNVTGPLQTPGSAPPGAIEKRSLVDPMTSACTFAL